MANNNHLYADRQARLDTLVGQTTALSVKKYKHWKTLIKAKANFDKLWAESGKPEDIDAFYSWLEETYGIRLQRIEGMIGQDFTIVDEQKYLVYKLKFV